MLKPGTHLCHIAYRDLELTIKKRLIYELTVCHFSCFRRHLQNRPQVLTHLGYTWCYVGRFTFGAGYLPLCHISSCYKYSNIIYFTFFLNNNLKVFQKLSLAIRIGLRSKWINEWSLSHLVSRVTSMTDMDSWFLCPLNSSVQKWNSM